MINTPHIAELVKKGDVVGVKEAIVASGERGVQSFDSALHDLYKTERISLEEALSNAHSRTNLEAKINFGYAARAFARFTSVSANVAAHSPAVGSLNLFVRRGNLPHADVVAHAGSAEATFTLTAPQ
jgi:hypothetical protein